MEYAKVKNKQSCKDMFVLFNQPFIIIDYFQSSIELFRSYKLTNSICMYDLPPAPGLAFHNIVNLGNPKLQSQI